MSEAPQSPDYETLFESLPGLYLVLSPDFQIVAASDAYLRATMTERYSILGRHLFDVFPDNPDDPAASGVRNLRASLDRLLRTGEPDTMAVQKYDVRRPDGEFEERYWSPVNSPVFEPGTRNIVYIIHRVEDVTEFIRLKRSNQEQHQAGEKLRAEAERMESEIYLRASELQEANRRLEEANRELETANERIRMLDELKNQFFANVSHELRTPLALILGPVEELLQDRTLPPNASKSLATIERNAKLLLKQVNDLLDIAKLEAGSIRPRYARIDMARFIRRVAAHFETVADTRRIRLSIDTPATVEGEIDADKIERVLLNLFSNAFKFVPAGGVVECELELSGNDVVISISDNGPGIPEQMRDAVFERFRQLEGGATRGAGGTGLGLAIVKEFVDLHHGSVRVGSSRSGGARFEVRLPRWAPAGTELDRTPHVPAADTRIAADSIKAELQPVADSPGSNRGEERTTSAGRILIAEDNGEMRNFLADLLGQQWTVETATNGREALEMARRMTPDVIVSDLMMPTMSGEDLLRAVKGGGDPLRQVPVLLLTARADESTILDLLRKGADDYVSKPFTPEELRLRVSRLVTIKRTRDLMQRELASSSEDLADLGAELREALTALRLKEDLLRRALDSSDKANRAKDEFLTVLSHELRTPLTSILGWVELLRMGQSDAETMKDGLDAIRRGARLQTALVEELLDVSRIVTGRLRLQMEPVDPARIVENVVDSFRAAADAKGQTLEVALPVSRHINGDENRLQQIVWNLVSNAVKFTPGGGRVRVAVTYRGPDAIIEVSDTGVGIAPDFLPSMFDRFRQADSSPTRQSGGLGLGLSIVRYLVELHGGTIEAESEGVGKGATFRVTLPALAEVNRVQMPARPGLDDDGAPQLRGRSILVVDDEPATVAFLTAFLRRCGARVRSASSVREAIAAAEEEWPEVLITDIAMPHEDGFALLEKIRARQRELTAIALTAHARADERTRFLAAGFDDFIAKPASPAEIATVIARSTRRRQHEM